MRKAVLLCALVGLCGPLAPGAFGDDGSTFLVADTAQVGHIDLYLFGADGTQAELFERVGEKLVVVGQGTVQAPATAFRVRDAATWGCARRTRRFEAMATSRDGTVHRPEFTVRTPPCRDRLGWTTPRVGRPGALVAVTLRDRWGLGDIAPRLCVDGRSCRRVPLRGGDSVTRWVRLASAGSSLLTLQLGNARLTTRVPSTGDQASRPHPLPTVLVAGDSTIQGVDTALSERLAGTARVVLGWRGGSSLSADRWRWIPTAKRQARRLRPRVTVVSLGANEGWPMTLPDGSTAVCCEAPWRAEYARRVGRMMRAYSRGGKARVLWLLLPTPRDPRRQVISEVVNAAIREAALAADSQVVSVVPIDSVISPGGFRRTLSYRGRDRVVRQADGVHLTMAGAAIATDMIMRVLATAFAEHKPD